MWRAAFLRFMIKTIKKQILRYGEWDHEDAPDGKLVIDKSFAKKLVNNFKKIPFAPVIRGHDEDAAEKNTELIVSKNVDSLEFDDNGVNAVMKIDPKEIEKYNDVSAAMDMEYTDHESGKFLGPVLRHVAMVMNPYLKGLNPFAVLGDSNNLIINLSDIMKKKDIKEKDQVELEKKAKEEAAAIKAKAEESEADETSETEVKEKETEEEQK